MLRVTHPPKRKIPERKQTMPPITGQFLKDWSLAPKPPEPELLTTHAKADILI